MAAPESKTKLAVAVEKPTSYDFDLGLLLANDPNPVELDRADLEGSLRALARDGAQALVNQLLTACPIQSTPSGVLLSLPPQQTPLPREKPVPAAREPTKWERFAAKKGIKPKTREQRRNTQYNEEKGEWERKWGYKGANKQVEKDWVVEVDPEKEAKLGDGETIRGASRRERVERQKRNERKMRKNERDAVQKRK
ncbi:hypothetical protein RB595_007200 [Gaeumannomyces hyphopodioides]